MSNYTKLFNYTVKDLTQDADFRRWMCALSKNCSSGGGGGAVSSVNGETGDVLLGLQEVTDVNFSTNKSLVSTGFSGLSPNSTGIFKISNLSGFANGTATGAIGSFVTLNDTTGEIRLVPNGAVNPSPSLAINKISDDTGIIAKFDGRVQGTAATTNGEFVIYDQVIPVIQHPYKGGQSVFTADGTTTVFNITHNLGAIPSFFSLTTTQPIAANHLTRTITFPDNNTMRLTFALPPNPTENANYVWIVYK